jgi:hypothetical protein
LREIAAAVSLFYSLRNVFLYTRIAPKHPHMENYRIYFEEEEREDVLRILRRFSDILIDNINTNSFGITIERDDAEAFYVRLLDQIDREVYQFRPNNIFARFR